MEHWRSHPKLGHTFSLFWVCWKCVNCSCDPRDKTMFLQYWPCQVDIDLYITSRNKKTNKKRRRVIIVTSKILYRTLIWGILFLSSVYGSGVLISEYFLLPTSDDSNLFLLCHVDGLVVIDKSWSSWSTCCPSRKGWSFTCQGHRMSRK